MKAAARLKRKDIDRVNDEFSNFSLSSPATKIRRLDAELLTIVEHDESERSLPFVGGRMEVGEEAEMVANEERAIVLFRPVNEHLLHHRSPSSFSVSVDSELISGFKSQFPWSNRSSGGDFFVDEVAEDDTGSSFGKCKAVVPWAPMQFPPAPRFEIIDSEVMETEDAGSEGAMEVEEENSHPNQVVEGVDQIRSGYGGFQPWQQQHCLTSRFSQAVSTPIVCCELGIFFGWNVTILKNDDIAQHLTPLQAQLKKNAAPWSAVQTEAVKYLKQQLQELPPLQIPYLIAASCG